MTIRDYGQYTSQLEIWIQKLDIIKLNQVLCSFINRFFDFPLPFFIGI